MSILYFDCETTSADDDAKLVLAVTRTETETKTWVETPFQCFTKELARKLSLELIQFDGRICTFNGAGFDFKVLAKYLDSENLKKKLIRKCLYDHEDIFFDFFTSNGYFASLESFCVGCKLPSKTWSGSESALAVKNILSGNVSQADTIEIISKLDRYCKSDTACLQNLYMYLKQHCRLDRTSMKSGNLSSWTP